MHHLWMRGREMKVFHTRAHIRTWREITWVYGVKQGVNGLKEVRVGLQWHNWPKKETWWFIWNERYASDWVRAQKNWSIAR